MNISKVEKTVKYTAFLRGINIGGKVLIKMDELRKQFESIGFENVKTVLASGNVLFEAKQQEASTISQNIRLKLRQAFGREIIVIVYPVEKLRELEKSRPFNDIEITRDVNLLVTFVPEGLNLENISFLSQDKDFTIKSIHNRMICGVLRIRPGKGTPDLMNLLDKAFGKSITNRTWGTILKILKASDQNTNPQ
jgi:uncharacterized protein (DUF1697 family)